MRLRTKTTMLGGLMLAVAMSVTSCTGESAPTASDRSIAGPDINAQDRDQLQEGGDLRVPIDALPSNFNPKQVNGARVVTYQLADAILPSAFLDTADGVPAVNKNYFDAIELISSTPQKVRYSIAANAKWSNGRSLTWQDLRGHWAAVNGTDKRFEVSNHIGYQDVASVERGASDKEAVLTFSRPFADWQGLFRPLVPAELTETSEAFNKSWLNGPAVTSGAFEVASVDTTAKVVTLKRNESWWGQRPALDRVIFRVLAPAARADELANGGIDLYPIGGDVDLFTRAQSIPGVEIRQATERRAGQLTFNGAAGALLSDERLRIAIAQAIDPQQVTDVIVGPVAPGTKAVGNHIVPPGYAGYRDNSSALPFDPAAARAALDAQGWKLDGKVRTKDGKPLSLRFVVQATPTGRTVSGVIAEQLAAVGVEAKIESVPTERFQDTYLQPGNFDLIAFEWTKSPYPISHDRPVFQTPVDGKAGNNFGRVVVPGIQELYDRAIAEFDVTKRDALVDEIDILAWKYAHHLPLYPESGAYAVRTELANYGARGLGGYGFAAAGFMK
ncbi:ABC transporter family substrate-binding protein [Nocardia sp. NPDC050710]|uniref:ABC transporter family substrate-binding protein n=1 Tax=Nocardia sp. NPDC050710 TaxID=3157220 RepID=UPI0033FE379F